MSSCVYTDNKNKDIVFLGEGPTQGLYDTTLKAESQYPIIFTMRKKICIRSTLSWKQQFLFC